MNKPALYDGIGRTYRSTRRADPRIVAELMRQLDLPPGATVCDVGAGSGNYTRALADAGLRIIAVEPSATMRAQASPHERVAWRAGCAERIPLADAAVAGVICTLAAHHFANPSAAAGEMHRICPNGPLVFFTMDPRRGQPQWFEDYFPEIRRNDFLLFPPVEDFVATVREATGRTGEVIDFPLPRDLVDQFMYAPWLRPETYLDPVFRANTSGFATADASRVATQVARLRDDLATGRWDARHGALRTLDHNDAGFCIVAFRS